MQNGLRRSTLNRLVGLFATFTFVILLWRLYIVRDDYEFGVSKASGGSQPIATPGSVSQATHNGNVPPNKSAVSPSAAAGSTRTSAVYEPATTAAAAGEELPKTSKAAQCASYPQDASVVIVVKTGATEAFDKLPTILMTYLSCVPHENLLIFSDMASSIGPYKIHDSLDHVVLETTQGNKDFDLYRQQKELKKLGQHMGMLPSKQNNKAWNLDKYKNIHTAQKAWDLAPDRDWYVYIDADTYITWPNFFAWLEKLNPKKKLYVGSEVRAGTQWFAHGGSGYMLSKPAMKLLVGDDRAQVAADFDKGALSACCGDQELARSLHRKKLEVENWRPMINGEKASRFGYGPKLWCTPVVTQHHMTSSEVQDIWQFEGQREDPTSPILAEDLYRELFSPLFVPKRADWDNLSHQTIVAPKPGKAGSVKHHDPSLSFEHCRQTCEGRKDCFQFAFHNSTCQLSQAFHLGEPRYPKKEKYTQLYTDAQGMGLEREVEREIKYESGWMVERIRAWVENEGRCMLPSWDRDL